MMPLPTRSTPPPQSTNKVNRYYLVREIGSGSMGTVYVARDPVVDRNVAIKTFSSRLNSVEKKQAEAQFVNEARAAGRLCHPNIVTIFDAGNEPGAAYIAMEYLQGTVLGKLLDGDKKFSADEVAIIAGKLADALAHAHKNGVIHRDINPRNIFMISDNEPKIFDFGIARAPNRLQDDQADEDQPFTLFCNNLLGTPSYMSPEQATGRAVDHLTDVYSLGAVMYEMLVSQKPFRAESTEMLLESIAYKAPPAPHELNKAVPIGLSQIVMKAMSKRPEKRYQSADEMVQDLNRYRSIDRHQHAKPAPAPQPEPKPSQATTVAVAVAQKKSRSSLVVGGIALLGVLMAGGYFWLHQFGL